MASLALIAAVLGVYALAAACLYGRELWQRGDR
jgi:hypothetical protein